MTKEIKIPENLVPESRSFVSRALETRDKPMGENGSYGHAARRIATCVLGVAELNESPEEQKRMLRKKNFII